MFYSNSVRCQKLQLSEMLSFSLNTAGPQSFCYSFIALIVRCSTSARVTSGCVKSQSLLLLRKPHSWF